MVQNHVKSQGKAVATVDYRNLAPLYCSEPVKLCGRETGPDKFEVWAETPEGGIAVKGTATVRSL
jgi:hydroxyacyl-ACP dehydratase HTD2-like protein with hotdog domain